MTIEPTGGISPFDAIKHTDDAGVDYWLARQLQPFLGYGTWHKFLSVIEQAAAAAQLVGVDPAANFTLAGENSPAQVGRPRVDYRLSRYGAYLIAMRGDSRKPEIASALTYFAVKTREAEIAASPTLPRDYEQALVALLGEVREKKALEQRIAKLSPSAEAWERLASANGDFSVRVAANILNRDPHIQTGQNRLFAIIRGMDMVSKGDIPYQKHTDHLRLKPGSAYEHPKTGEKTINDPQLRVTIRGLQYLHKRLGGVVPISRHVQAELAFDGEAEVA